MKLNLFVFLFSSIISALLFVLICYWLGYGKIDQADLSMSFFSTSGVSIGERSGGFRLVANPFTLYANYPSQDTAKYGVDANGFRNTYKNKNAVKNGFILGSSAAFGYGIDDDNLTLASKVSELNRQYNITNAAVVGFSSGQDLAQMVHYTDDFKPDLYIVVNAWNDINTPARFTNKWPTQQIPLGFNSMFFSMQERLENYSKIISPFKTRQILNPSGLESTKDEYFEKVINVYLSNIEKMHAFASARGASFLLVLQAELSLKKHKTSEEEQMLKNWDLNYEYLDREIPQKYSALLLAAREFCAGKNIPFIDLNQEAAFNDNRETLFLDVVHPNTLGHKLIAEIITKRLDQAF